MFHIEAINTSFSPFALFSGHLVNYTFALGFISAAEVIT